jgi:dTDP-glucose 4,6-dehydratase
VRLVRESGCRRNEKRNIEVVNMICDVLDEISPRQSGPYRDLFTFVEDRREHDRRYAIDC